MPVVIVATLVVLQVLLIFVHLAVYAVASTTFGIGGLLFKTIVITLALTFLSASFLSHWFRNKFIDWYYAAAAYWFGLVHFLFVGAVAFFFSASILYRLNYYVPPALLGGIFFGALFLLHGYGTWKSGRAEITFLNLALPNIPEWWRNQKIVFVSDLHLGNVRRRAFATKVVRKIRALRPEAVFIGGDLYDGVACDVEGIIEPLRALRAPQGVYFVTGNHEYFLPDLEKAFAAIRGIGIRILNNEKVDIRGIIFLGVDNKAVRRKEDFERILGEFGIDGSRPTILIKHEPNYLRAARDAGIALGFFGHTHGGQIFPLNFLTRRIYRGFDSGLKQLDGMRAYTSSGVGTWGPPLRLGTKSEIVCITLR